MKRTIACLMVAVMLLVSLMGCAGKEAASDDSQGSPVTSAEERETEATEAAEATEVTEATEATKVSSDSFDAFVRPKTLAEGETFRMGAITKDVSAESIKRIDHQLQIECAHRGWDYVPVYYETEANYNDAFMSLINQNVHAIVLINPMSVETHVDLYKTAREMEIGVYSIIGSIDQGIITDIGIPGSVATMQLLYRVGIDYNWDLDIAAIRCDSQLASSERMYPVIGYLEGEFRPNMKLVVTDDVSALLTSLGSSMMAGQEMARTWLQKYGDEINCIFSYGDNGAMGAAEVIKANGDPNGEKCFVIGIDGGKQSWAYIRDDSPLKYSYAQPMELFAHQVSELVRQIQIEGMNPGDPGCLLDKAGNAIYTEGSIVTKDNVPAIGTSIHCAFDYYDASVTGEAAWWDWTDGPGIYMVEAYEG